MMKKPKKPIRPPGEAHPPDSRAIRVRDKGPGAPAKRAYQACAVLAAMGNILDNSPNLDTML